MESATIAQEYKELSQGLDFILWHFSNQEALFPRAIMTYVTVGLKRNRRPTVYDKTTMISYYEGALRKDCRISAYPNYEDMRNKGLLPPSYTPRASQLFIDLDLDSHSIGNDKDKLDKALYETLCNIAQHLNGAVPTVLWTGGGYHVYLPLDTDFVPPYEELPDFQNFVNDKFPPSVKFLRYAEKRLTNNKSDDRHNPSFESCLWRIPGSINSKHHDQQGESAKVTIVQRWNGVRARPSDRFMYTDFLVYLAQERIDQIREERQQSRRYCNNNNNNPSDGVIPLCYRYVEDKLLKTPIEDNRKHAIDVIIIPYCVVIKGMTDTSQIQNIAMQWLDKCAGLKRLEPSRYAFASRINSRINQVIDAHSKGEAVPPMKWDTLKAEYPELYDKLINVPY